MALGYARERGAPLVLPVLLEEVQIPGPLSQIQGCLQSSGCIGLAGTCGIDCAGRGSHRMIVGVPKFAFSLGRSFMVEALRKGDRSHAISFGEFYLKAFGEKAAWAEVKEAFQHRNVETTGSSFASQSAKEYDPELIEKLTTLVKEIRLKSTEK